MLCHITVIHSYHTRYRTMISLRFPDQTTSQFLLTALRIGLLLFDRGCGCLVMPFLGTSGCRTAAEQRRNKRCLQTDCDCFAPQVLLPLVHGHSGCLVCLVFALVAQNSRGASRSRGNGYKSVGLITVICGTFAGGLAHGLAQGLAGGGVQVKRPYWTLPIQFCRMIGVFPRFLNRRNRSRGRKKLKL